MEAIQGDLREPLGILGDPVVCKLIRPGQPACVVLARVLHLGSGVSEVTQGSAAIEDRTGAIRPITGWSHSHPDGEMHRLGSSRGTAESNDHATLSLPEWYPDPRNPGMLRLMGWKLPDSRDDPLELRRLHAGVPPGWACSGTSPYLRLSYCLSSKALAAAGSGVAAVNSCTSMT